MQNSQEFLFINLLLNGIIINKLRNNLDTIEIKTTGLSYNWGENYLRQYNSDTLEVLLGGANSFSKLLYNNLVSKFAIKVHSYNKEYIMNNVTPIKQYNIQNIDIPNTLNKILDELNVPVVILILNFNGLKIVQATPESLGIKTKWFFKEINVKFESYNLFASKIFKKLEAFLSQNLSLPEIYNIMYNYINFPTLQVTNNKMLDILRSILLELLVESLEHTDIPNFNNGLLIVTGELATLFGYKEYAYLSLIDGLLLNGIWGVLWDSNHIFLNLLYLIQNKQLKMNSSFLEILLPYLDIFHVSWGENVPLLEVGYATSKKFIGRVNHLIKYPYNKKSNIFYSKDTYNTGSTNKEVSYYELALPTAIYIKDIIIDNRQRPIAYGPGPLANKSRIHSNIADLMKYES